MGEMGEMGEIQPEICLPSTRIWCREPMWIGISASGHGSTTASTHLRGTGEDGAVVSACMRGMATAPSRHPCGEKERMAPW